ncbi:unnamed protein product, partial [Mesorhabditis belari]|uniref:UFSP1/2/DUB catalytic domain-containing protein n=1 Tax=Mesorhabditis belari TaxID=2138241 RepID=A0AAF3J992_9BILA
MASLKRLKCKCKWTIDPLVKGKTKEDLFKIIDAAIFLPYQFLSSIEFLDNFEKIICYNDDFQTDAVTVLTKPKFLDTTLPHGKCSVYLIGSNHISIKSQNDIERTIKSVDPNVIMLELCIKRTDILSDYITEERFKQPQKQKGTFVSTIYSAIKNARKTDGRDFWAAYRVANKNCPIVLGDRIGDINRQRLASVITFTEVFRYVTLYLKWIYNGGLNQEKIDDRLLEKLQQDCPRMWKVWVKERDVYMTFVLQTLVKELIGKEKNNLDNRSAWRIVAVVGMGHVKGICENWNSTVVLPPDLMEMPPSSIQAEILKVLSWIEIQKMGKKETWILSTSSVFENFRNFSSWFEIERTRFVGVLFGNQLRIDVCLFLSDNHLKQHFFEFVTNSLASDLIFAGIVVVNGHEPDTDISYMGTGLEIRTTLETLQSSDSTFFLKSYPNIIDQWTQPSGVTLVSNVMFETVLRRGLEENDIKMATEKFAAAAAELIYHHKESDIVLQANTKHPKFLDDILKDKHTDQDRLRLTSYRRVSAQDEGNGDDQKHVPILKVQAGDIAFRRLRMPLWITAAAYGGDGSNEIYLRIEEAIRRRIYNVMYVMMKGFRKTYDISEVDCRCFLPANHSRILSIVMPRLADKEQQEWRIEMHKIFNLPSRVPCLRSLQAIDFSARAHFLRTPHLSIKNYKKTGRITTVKGMYDYYHYTQQGIDDNGWGCAYRSLQTIWSWYVLNGFFDRPIPLHREIQEALVRIEGEELRGKKFIGSKQWIGSFEIGYILSDAISVDCSYIAQFTDISEKARELQIHFESVGSPVMIGGNMLAHTILGVDFDENTGECRFLVLDPHYTGIDDVNTVINKGWCAWKMPSFWKTGIDQGGQPILYNIVKPQLPTNII